MFVCLRFKKKKEIYSTRGQRESERDGGFRASALTSHLPVPEHKPAPSPSPDRGRFRVTSQCWGGRRRASERRFPAASVPPSYTNTRKASLTFGINAHMENTGHFLSHILHFIFTSFAIISNLKPLTLLQILLSEVKHSSD